MDARLGQGSNAEVKLASKEKQPTGLNSRNILKKVAIKQINKK